MGSKTWVLWVGAMTLVACGDDPGTDAGGGGADAATALDSGSTDSGSTDSGASTDPEVARCQAAAIALSETCPTDGNRTCHTREYGSFCHVDADPGAFADALDCLRASSSSAGCRTFSDPSGAEACVDPVYAAISDPEVDEVVALVNGSCGGPGTGARTEPPFYALTPAQLATLRTCVEAAADCAATAPCAQAAAGSIASCYP